MNACAPTNDLIEVAQFVTFWMTVTGVGHITLVSIQPDAGTDTRTFHRGDDYAMSVWIAEAQRAGRNIYFQPNETFPDCASKPAKIRHDGRALPLRRHRPSRLLSPRRRAQPAIPPGRSPGQ